MNVCMYVCMYARNYRQIADAREFSLNVINLELEIYIK